MTNRLISPRLWTAFFSLEPRLSSLNTTSSVQCRLFSMFQCLRTAIANNQNTRQYTIQLNYNTFENAQSVYFYRFLCYFYNFPQNPVISAFLLFFLLFCKRTHCNYDAYSIFYILFVSFGKCEARNTENTSVKESRTFIAICAASQRRRNGDFYEKYFCQKIRLYERKPSQRKTR